MRMKESESGVDTYRFQDIFMRSACLREILMGYLEMSVMGQRLVFFFNEIIGTAKNTKMERLISVTQALN